jgi:hypothetical protein
MPAARIFGPAGFFVTGSHLEHRQPIEIDNIVRGLGRACASPPALLACGTLLD